MRFSSIPRSLVPLIPLLVIGCTQGSHQWYEKANPQTSLSVSPLSRTVTFFSSDGKTLTAEKLAGGSTPEGGWYFEFVNVEIRDRSVENRQADVEQIAAMGTMMARIAEANWAGFREAMAAIVSEALAPLKGASVSVDTPLGSGSVTTGGATTQPGG